MSCDSQNYTTRSAYDEHMLKMYHSPVWVQNEKTRTLYDLDLQKQYLNNTQRYVPNFPDNFKVRETVGQAPWNSFNNVMVKEGYAGNALCNTPRTMFDVDMINTYNTIGSNHRVVGDAPWSNFNNLDSQGNKVQFLCSNNVPMRHGGSAPMRHGGSAPMHRGGSAPMHRGGRHPTGGRGRGMDDGVSTRGGAAPMRNGGSAPMHRGGRHPTGGRGRGMDDGVSTRGGGAITRNGDSASTHRHRPSPPPPQTTGCYSVDGDGNYFTMSEDSPDECQPPNFWINGNGGNPPQPYPPSPYPPQPYPPSPPPQPYPPSPPYPPNPISCEYAQGDAAIFCCAEGGESTLYGQCPPGCVDMGGECIPRKQEV